MFIHQEYLLTLFNIMGGVRMVTREELIDYINNCITCNNLVTRSKAIAIATEDDSPLLNDIVPLLENSVNVDNFFLKKDSNDKITLVYCRPSYVMIDFGDCIDTIGTNAFFDNKVIRRVCGIGVREISPSAFFASNIQVINFPNLRIIKNHSFVLCSKLEMVISPFVYAVGNYAFGDCRNLSTVKMSPAYIGHYAFHGCISINEFDFSQVKYIGKGGFGDCFSLHGIDAPNLIGINKDAFADCHSLMYVVAPNLIEGRVSDFKGCYSLNKAMLKQLS